MKARMALSALAGFLVPACASAQPSQVIAAAGKTVDKATFVVTLHGKPVGQEDMEITERGNTLEMRTSTTLNLGPVGLRSRGTLVTETSFRPLAGDFDITLSGVTQKLTLRRADGGLRLTTQAAEKAATTTKETRASDLFLANGVLAHLTALCALASPAERNLTAFPGVGIKLFPATRQAGGGRTGRETRLTFVAADFAQLARIELVCDGTRMLALRQPIASLAAARLGYEDLVGALEQKERIKPPTPESLAELPRKVEVPAHEEDVAAQLQCSLLVPKAYADVAERSRKQAMPRLPAVVFITGSGPQDRDEDTVGPGGLKLSVFKVIANELGEAGIASLRCDDRGTGRSSGEFEKATLGTFVRDTEAAMRALRQEPAIDPARVGLIGHSEGAIIAPMVALDDGRIEALVLMAGAGRPLDLIILEQEEDRMRRSGIGEDEIRRRLAESKDAFENIRAGRSLTAPQAETFGKPARWLRSHFLHDPVATARALNRVPVLIAQGGRDLHVSSKDAELLRDALTKHGNRQVTYKLYPELNHLFAPTKTGSLADYSDPEARIDDVFLRDVVAFLRGALRSRGKPSQGDASSRH